MTDLTRDDLAVALATVRDDTEATGGVRVELARLNGSVEALTTEVRLQVVHLAKEQADQRTETSALQDDVRTLQQWQWRVAGAIGVLSFLVGGAGALFIG